MNVKNVLSVTLVSGLFMLLTMGCKKDSADPYKCASCTTTPQALAANDASSKGIYKGVFIASSGTIVFDVMNNSTDIKATMVIDGVTVNLVSAISWQAGQAYIAPFTGTYNGGAVSITFSVGANGASPVVTTSSIMGHPNAEFTIVKETSTSLIEAFEGTYHTTLPEDGTFNLLLSRSAKVWGAEARENGATASDDASGSINTENKLVELNGTVMGTLTEDEINGSFPDSNGKTVTIKGKRTL